VFCRAHAVQLNRDREKFDEVGVRLVLIGQGTPDDAADFRRHNRIDLPILTDRRRETYRMIGTKVGTIGELLGPTVVARGIKQGAQERLSQGRTRGHPAQLGGVVIVMPDSSIAYSHLADDASDNPPSDEVLKAAAEAVSTVDGT
jgi:AhpC/TSA antioxidant enzyme